MNLRKLFLVTLIMSGEAGELESMPSSSSTPQHPVSSRDIIMYIVYTRVVNGVSRKFSHIYIFRDGSYSGLLHV